MAVVACAAGPGRADRGGVAARRGHGAPDDDRPVARLDGGLVDVPRPRPRPDAGLGVRVGGRPARPRRPVRRAGRRSRCTRPAARRRRRPPTAGARPRRARAPRASSWPGTSSTCCRASCSTTSTRSAGTRGASGGRRRRSTAGRSAPSTSPPPRTASPGTGALAVPGRRGRRRARPRAGPPGPRRRPPRLPRLQLRHGARLGVRHELTPSGVGRFVLDGAIDPTAGDPHGPLSADGVPDYAADELDDVDRPVPRAVRRQRRCAPPGPTARRSSTTCEATIRDLPTADFPGGPSQMSRIDLDDLMVGITYDPWSWGLVGDALRDGAERRRLDARRPVQLPARRATRPRTPTRTR